jgi:hypothetical protein
MNPWIAKALVLAGTVVMIAIRAPHGRRSRIVKVNRFNMRSCGGTDQYASSMEVYVTFQGNRADIEKGLQSVARAGTAHLNLQYFPA